LQNFRSKRFCCAISIGGRRRARGDVDLSVGIAHRRKARRVVGGDHLHAVTADIYPRQSRRRRYVAGPVCYAGALGWIRIAFRKQRTPNAQRPTLHIEFRISAVERWALGVWRSLFSKSNSYPAQCTSVTNRTSHISATAAFAWTNVCSDSVKMIAAHHPTCFPP